MRSVPEPSKSTSAPSSACPPVTITAVGPERLDRPASSSGSARSPRPGELARLGQVGGRPRWRSGRTRSISAALRVRVEQHRAALRTPSRGRRTTGASPTRSSASTTASIVGSSPSMPTLTASTPMSSATARTWATIISGGHRGDHLDPDRVLRGERRDRGHPVHAAARERLQVGLDARPAAGVRAGDRQARPGCRVPASMTSERQMGSRPPRRSSRAGSASCSRSGRRRRRARSPAAPAGRARPPRPPGASPRPGATASQLRAPALDRLGDARQLLARARGPQRARRLDPDAEQPVEDVLRAADRRARRRRSGRWSPPRPSRSPGPGPRRARGRGPAPGAR